MAQASSHCPCLPEGEAWQIPAGDRPERHAEVSLSAKSFLTISSGDFDFLFHA